MRVAGAAVALLRRRLVTLLSGASTALIVPVVGLPLGDPPVVGLPHHVTVLYPFLRVRRVRPSLLRALEATFGRMGPFDYELTAVRRFPEVLYLAPEPAERFDALTDACLDRWPEHPPYGGVYEQNIPHVTLAEGAEPAGMAERMAQLLPLSARAEEVWLMRRGRRTGWQRVARVRFAGRG